MPDRTFANGTVVSHFAIFAGIVCSMLVRPGASNLRANSHAHFANPAPHKPVRKNSHFILLGGRGFNPPAP